MIKDLMRQWLGEVIENLTQRICQETGYSYNKISFIVESEYVQICNETVTNAKKWYATPRMFIIWFAFFGLLSWGFGKTMNMSGTAFYLSALTYQVINYFIAFVSPFFKKIARKTNTKAVTDVTKVMFNLRRYLTLEFNITQIFTDLIISTLGFWGINKSVSFFGFEYLGFKTAICFGIVMSIVLAIFQYTDGKKYYRKIKNIVLQQLLPTHTEPEDADFELLN